MKLTFKIAKLGLQSLFYSPISWVVVTIFAFYSGINFTNVLDYLVQQPLGQSNIETSYTRFIFQSVISSGYFSQLQGVFFMFIPLLSMGLVSNEMNSGTIKLLYSSPVKTHTIVLGKYLAILIFSLVLIAFMVLVIVGAFMQVPDLDWGQVLPGVLGLFLLTSTYCAIGLFMSTLSRYQVVSGLATFAMFYIFDYIAGVGAGVPVIGGVLGWLSITAHSNSLLQGLLVSTDILFYLIITGLFLVFAVNKMTSDRLGKAAKYMMALRSLAMILVAGVIVYVLTQPAFVYYKDFTATKANSMNPEVVALLQRFDQAPLKALRMKNAIYDQLGPNGAVGPMTPGRMRAEWGDFVRVLPNMEFEGRYYYGDMPQDPNQSYDSSPFQGELKGLSAEEKAKRFAHYFGLDFNDFIPKEKLEPFAQKEWFEGYPRAREGMEYQGKQVFLLQYYDDALGMQDFEDRFNDIKQLLDDPIAVHVVTGHGERVIDRQKDADWYRTISAPSHRYGLPANGFNPSLINLKENSLEVGGILVIADPQQPYGTDELEQISQYLDRGGDLWIAAEGAHQEAIQPILDLIGVKMHTEHIQVNDPAVPPGLIANTISDSGFKAASKYYASSAEPMPVLMEGASPLTYHATGEFKIEPVLTTNGAQTWLGSDSTMQSFVTGLTLTRTVGDQQQKIFVTGDADLFANKEIRKNKRSMTGTGNSFLLRNMLVWFGEGVYPFKPLTLQAKDNTWKATPATVSFYKLIYVWVLPLLMLISGTVIWIRRRSM